MDFQNSSRDYLLDESVRNRVQSETENSSVDESNQTDKKKKLSDMSKDEKVAYYDSEIEKLKEKIRQAEAKKKKITTVTQSQRNHDLIVFGSVFLDKEKLYEFHKIENTKERDAKITEYALEVKRKANL